MAIAEATGGTYYPAESADELHEVFDEPADEPHHQARGDGDQRPLRRPGGSPDRPCDPRRSGLAPVAVAIRESGSIGGT